MPLSEYGELAGPALTLLALLVVYGIALGVFRRTDRGAEQRALMSVRSIRGNNAAMILAVLVVGEAFFEFGIEAPSRNLPFLVTAMFVSVALIAVFPRIAEPVFALAGLVSFCWVVFARHGSVTGLSYLAIAVAMIILLAVLRAVIPSISGASGG